MGVVQATSGRASWMRSKTRSSPSTIDADVQPKATTSRCSPGRISSTPARIRPSICPSVAAVISAELATRLS
jgi:hypothetical protein